MCMTKFIVAVIVLTGSFFCYQQNKINSVKEIQNTYLLNECIEKTKHAERDLSDDIKSSEEMLQHECAIILANQTKK